MTVEHHHQSLKIQSVDYNDYNSFTFFSPQTGLLAAACEANSVSRYCGGCTVDLSVLTSNMAPVNLIFAMIGMFL